MKTTGPGTPTALLLQFLCLTIGIALILSNRYWNRGPAVIASGIFFINIFWITMVITYDLKIWSALRNTPAGNIIMIGSLVINLLCILVLAVAGNLIK